MKTFTYFAYGSNMLTEWLTDRCRCPSAQAIGIAVAAGYVLEFCKPSIDKSGKATLISSKRIEDEVIGALFEIDNGDRCALNKAEGEDYNRCDKFSVTLLPDGKQTQVITYIASACAVNDRLKPYDWYLALVIQGAIQRKLPKKYTDSLHDFAFKTDPEQNRKTRKRAICALARAGVQDYKKILKSPDTG